MKVVNLCASVKVTKPTEAATRQQAASAKPASPNRSSHEWQYIKGVQGTEATEGHSQRGWFERQMKVKAAWGEADQALPRADHNPVTNTFMGTYQEPSQPPPSDWRHNQPGSHERGSLSPEPRWLGLEEDRLGEAQRVDFGRLNDNSCHVSDEEEPDDYHEDVHIPQGGSERPGSTMSAHQLELMADRAGRSFAKELLQAP